MISGFIIGLLFGVLLQRSQFCFVSGFRQLFTQGDWRFIAALFIAISVQSVGLFSLNSLQLIQLPQGEFSLIATLIGGLLFGLGMAMAGCCGSGAWFRSAEGRIGAWLALFAFVISLVAAQAGALRYWLALLQQQMLLPDSLYHSLGISPWFLVIPLLGLAALLFIWQWRQTTVPYRQSQGKLAYLNIYLSALLIGLLGVAAWFFSAQTGREFGFGIAVPSANVLQYLSTGQQRYLNWGSLFVIGLFVGAFLSAKGTGDFKLRLPDASLALRRVFGGIFMGIGATLAGGCTVTNSLVATAYFSAQGWLATMAILLGVWLSTKFIKPAAGGL